MAPPHPPPPHAASATGASPGPDPHGWTRFPYPDLQRFDAHRLSGQWNRLHIGQGLQPPAPGPLIDGWAHYHSGDFERAAGIGLQIGRDGLALANQATAIYASYLEPREMVRTALFRQVADRAGHQAAAEPDNCTALYWHAYSLSRYGQALSVARALAQGVGSKVKTALERVIALQPRHADAHIALAAFHAELIDKVGPLVARMTHGARADVAVRHFEEGLSLHPESANGLTEYARGLLILYGDQRAGEATRLYAKAAALEPIDARDRLDIELARAGMAD